MPTLRWYNLFISHAWAYNESYYRLERMLNDAANFQWHNLSVPEHDGLHVYTDQQLQQGLANQMHPADAFLIISGMYANHSQWIEYEISYARRIHKPVIAIRPWGSERMPTYIQNHATEIVGWNTDSIVAAIRGNALASGYRVI